MTKEQQNVLAFMVKARQATPSTPTIPDEPTRILRAKLILEEATELIVKGLGLGFNQEFGPDGIGWSFWVLHEPDLVEIADGHADLGVVNDGTAIACGPVEAK